MSDVLSNTSRSDDSMNVESPATSEQEQATASQASQHGNSNSSSSGAVSFSVYSEVILLPTDDNEDVTGTTYYNQEDMRRFQQVVLLDVQRLREELGSMAPEEINTEHMYDCVGLEKFLSQTLFQRTSAAIQAHLDGVLEEQASQRERIGVVDEEALASRSKLSSAWSRGRAEEIAAGYLRLHE